MTNGSGANLRALPAVERLAAHEALADLPRSLAIQAARRAVDEARAVLRSGSGDAPSADAIAARAAEIAREAESPTLRRAVNATGVLLHTNLGRATLAPPAAKAAAEIASGHASLEVDEATGGRGSRQAHVAGLLRALTGAEDAFVVNNNAAATFLAITSLAAGREVILSRGQMVEIGGQFRLPDVIESAGARLVEVGTTNRTRIGDYAAKINERTALILRCHPSNYRIVGFTESADLTELVALGRQSGVPVGDDIGSGALVDLSTHGLHDEPTAPGSVANGADVVWFSGDKLLGGPQAGILVGKSTLLGPMKKHPLARALRPDKMTLAALEATLRLYLAGRAWAEVPILRRIARTEVDVREAAERMAKALNSSRFHAEVVSVQAEVGGGSLPGLSLPSWAVAVSSSSQSAAQIARALRRRPVPVYGRIERDRLLLDLRAVDPDEEEDMVAALFGIL